MFSIISKIKSALKQVNSLNSIHHDLLYQNRVNQLNDYVLHSVEKGITEDLYCDHEIIVSLTTYEPRLFDVYLAIESIMQQTMKANRIVLWLSNNLQDEPLPETLKLQQIRGLEIKYCKDIGSYKKLIPSLKEFPEAAIITIDDDLLYQIDVLEKLMKAYLKDSQYIYYNRGHQMIVNEGILLPYSDWNWFKGSMEASIFNFPTGVAGVIYPPRIFNEEIFNEEVFMDICKYADDVWFKAMALYNNKFSRKVFTHNPRGEDYISNENVQGCALQNINNGQLLNDIQIKAVFEKYNLYKKLI